MVFYFSSNVQGIVLINSLAPTCDVGVRCKSITIVWIKVTNGAPHHLNYNHIKYLILLMQELQSPNYILFVRRHLIPLVGFQLREQMIVQLAWFSTNSASCWVWMVSCTSMFSHLIFYGQSRVSPISPTSSPKSMLQNQCS